MKYNDYSILTDKDYQVINQRYAQTLSEENEELRTILSKMQEQRDELLSHNSSGIYNNVLDKLELNISELTQIINNNTPTNTYSTSLPSFIKSRILNSDETAISPTRGSHEMRGHTQPLRPSNKTSPLPTAPNSLTPTSPALPESPFLPNNTTPSTNPTPNPTLPTTSPTDTPPSNVRPAKRNRPSPSSIISNFIKSFKINNIFSKSIKSDSIDYSVHPHRNKFHNFQACTPNDNPNKPYHHLHPENHHNIKHSPKSYNKEEYSNSPQEAMLDYYNNSPLDSKKDSARNRVHSHTIYNNIYNNIYNTYNRNNNINTCSLRNRLHYNQIDIIRLLLLYLALRPNCRFCSRISTLANDQFDILLDLDSMQNT